MREETECTPAPPPLAEIDSQPLQNAPVPQDQEIEPTHEVPRKPRISANLTEKERYTVFYYLGKARGSLHTNDDDLGIEVYRKACDFLRKSNSRVPSHISLRKLWLNFMSTGKVIKKKGGGRKPKPRPINEDGSPVKTPRKRPAKKIAQTPTNKKNPQSQTSKKKDSTSK